MEQYDVIILGAGAAGLMCAIEAGKRGRRVLVLEKSNKPGKKILMSGGGRCNFTNLQVTSENYISHNPHFCRSALSRYTPSHFIELVNRYQIAYHEKTLGQLFCDDSSKDILNLLLKECEKHHVVIQLNTNIEKFSAVGDNRFEVETSNARYQSESSVIATGGLSIPSLGSSPFGYQIASQFGLKVWPTRAGLVPLTLQESEKEKLADLSGIALDCRVSSCRKTFRESMLFTHRGLSGPALLQISSYWELGETLEIALLPDVDLYELLKTSKMKTPKTLLKNALYPIFPKRVVNLWLEETDLEKSLQYFTDNALQVISNHFQKWLVKPHGTEGYRTAEVTLGGVDCDEISSKTFEARQVKGLYFIGEVLDVTGWLGGYNFQWAWASGHAAGQFV